MPKWSSLLVGALSGCLLSVTASLEMVANFGAAAFAYEGNSIPPGSILAAQMKTGARQTYSPGG